MKRIPGKKNGKKKCAALTNAKKRCSHPATFDGLCTRHYMMQREGKRIRRQEQEQKCHKLIVKREVCGIKFLSEYRYDHSLTGFETIDGDEMIIDLDENGKVAQIEFITLEGPNKPCGA